MGELLSLASRINLETQYERNLRVFNALSSKSSYPLSSYPMPSYEDVIGRLKSKQEILIPKIEKGMNELLIVPFDALIDQLMIRTEARIRDFFKGSEGEISADNDEYGYDSNDVPIVERIVHPFPESQLVDSAGRKIALNNRGSLLIDGLAVHDDKNTFFAVDHEGLLKYYPFVGKNGDGVTKYSLEEEAIDLKNGKLSADEASVGVTDTPGWHIILTPDWLNIPESHIIRKDEGENSWEEQADSLSSDVVMRRLLANEFGMIPEEYLWLFLNILEERKTVIDDVTATVMSGSFFGFSDNEYMRGAVNFPMAFWVNEKDIPQGKTKSPWYGSRGFDDHGLYGRGGNMWITTTRNYSLKQSNLGIRPVVRI